MGQKNNLVKNASFLMIAAMISKVIGLLYKSPLSSIVGNMGMGYISLAQNAYMILLMIQYSAGGVETDFRTNSFKRLQKCTEDFSRFPDLCSNRRRNCGAGVSVWGEIYYPEQSAKCDTGTSDFITDNFSVRYPRSVPRIFSGIS